MSERMDQAWDEAQRRYATRDRQAGFVSGAAWADANPQRYTITLAQSEAILEAGRVGRYEDHEAALRAAGIEVVDDA